jgi:phosphoribosylanthranilate isomerase
MNADPDGLIHVAGVIDRAEAELLSACGVRHMGFPLVLGYHREDLSPAEAAAIVTAMRDRVSFFLITYLDRASAIAGLCRELGVATVQLHGPIDPEELRALRADWREIRIIKSLIVSDDNADALAQELFRLSPLVDAFITDTYDPSTGACGATGKTHDWSVSRRLVQRSPKPVILAGGLNPDNVAEAIDIVRPAGIDVHTGIEGPDGRKQADRIQRFVHTAQTAFRKLA